MDHLYWDVYQEYPEGFSAYIEEAISFLHIYMGDVREAVAHSTEISKFGRVIYNESAWDTSKFESMKEIMTQPTHYDVVKEILLRIEKYRCRKIDVGFMGRWKNPYQIADTHLPTGVTVTFEAQTDNLITFRANFFSPDNWFSLQCKPLFKTDPIVEKDSHGSWNMNPVGLIAAKPEKCLANRRAVFNMLADYVKERNPLFSGFARSTFYFNAETSSAYVVNPSAKKDDLFLPLLYYFQQPCQMLYSDSTPVPMDKYKTTMVRDRRIVFEAKHFDL